MYSKKILLVEDDPNDEALILRAFGRSNFPNLSVIAHDGKEALDYLFCTGDFSKRNPHDLPSAVLLDLSLPRVAGLEVLKKIRENNNTKYIPAIILTASKDEKNIEAAYSLGANSFIKKPVRFEDYAEIINEIVKYWVLINEMPS